MTKSSDSTASSSSRPLLLEAVKELDVETTRQMLAQGADPNVAFEPTQQTPLLLAALLGNMEIMRMLIDKGADINHVDNGGFTALTYAAKEGHYDIAKMLVDLGAELDHRVKIPGKKNALEYARSKDSTKRIAALIEEAPGKRAQVLDQCVHNIRDGIAAPMPASSPLVLKKPRPLQ